MRPPKDLVWRDYDAAHRMRDGMGLHYAALSTDELLAGRYVVVRLSDGHVDPNVFESRRDAVRHAPGLESLYAYFRLPLERLPAQACDVLLWYVRTAYDNGYRPDVDKPDRELIIPGRIDDIHSDILGRPRHGV